MLSRPLALYRSISHKHSRASEWRNPHSEGIFLLLAMFRCSGDNNRLDIRRPRLKQSRVPAGYAVQSPSSEDGSSSGGSTLRVWLLRCFQNAGWYWLSFVVCIRVGFLPWQKVLLLGQWRKCGKNLQYSYIACFILVFMKYGIPF